MHPLMKQGYIEQERNLSANTLDCGVHLYLIVNARDTNPRRHTIKRHGTRHQLNHMAECLIPNLVI